MRNLEMEKSKTDVTESPIDIFVWSDGYWCCRADFSPYLKPNFNYRVIPVSSPEWLHLADKRRPLIKLTRGQSFKQRIANALGLNRPAVNR